MSFPLRRNARDLGCALIGALAFALLALTSGSLRPAYAQPAPGQNLSVQLINGTPQGAGVAGVALTVFKEEGTQIDAVGNGQTDERGAFTWANLIGAVDARYVISATYQGVLYKTEPAALPAAVTLRVYDAAGDDSAVRIANAGFVIVKVDAPTQVISLLETVTLRNTGSRAFLPSAGGPRGPMGLLRFGLPEGSGNFTPDAQLAASDIIQVDKGFATDLPLPPGDTAVSFTYDLAYGALPESGYATLTSVLPYPADLVKVLSIPGDFSVESAQLTANGTATIGARVYRQYQAVNLPARAELTIELRNLPLVQPPLRPGNPWLQLVVGVFLLAAIVLPLVYKRRYARARGRTVPADHDLPAPLPDADPPATPAVARRVIRPPKAKKEGTSV